MKNNQSKSGFTLIELAAVILLLAILSGAVVIRLAGPLSDARWRDVRTEVDVFFTVARSSATLQGKSVQVVLDLDTNTVLRKSASETEAHEKRLALSDSATLRRVVTRGGECSSGQMVLRYSPCGVSESVAMELLDRNQQSHWLLVGGLTGQVTEMKDENEVQKIFAALAALHDAG